MVTETADESALIAALRAGDRSAFVTVVEHYSPSLLRVAGGFVPNHSIAEEVVQETWIALIKGIHGFEGRSSLRTWLFAVTVNIAKTRGVRERRDANALAEFTGEVVALERFHDPGKSAAGSWREPPTPFPEGPEASVLASELHDVAQSELDKLPPRQRTVVTLRDMLGFGSAEVCELLDLSVANQRVLLHRGRAAIRQALEDYVSEHAAEQAR